MASTRRLLELSRRFTIVAVSALPISVPISVSASECNPPDRSSSADTVAARQTTERWEAGLAATSRLRASVRASSVNVVFLGDSITRGWPSELWRREFHPYGALNLGLNGDRTESLLWRLQQGQWGSGNDALKPKVVVLMIGTNNLGQREQPDRIVADISAIIAFIRDKSAETKVLLLGVMPRKLQSPSYDSRLSRVNELLAQCADGKMIVFLDVSENFRLPNGAIAPSLFVDNVHLSPQGYERLAEGIRDTLHSMMNASP